MEKRKCLECGYELSGRIDKKFCSDYCRNTYNNRFHRDSTLFIRSVNNILRKNRRIMNSLNTSGKAKVHRNRLSEKGFNFEYFTNVYKTKSGNAYFFCYDQGYCKIKDDYVVLVKRQDYIDK